MDDRLIYVKTAEGELSIRERTRLVQRNLRMVLILVEGHLTVAELKAKVSDSQIIESALTELEQMGLIETLASRRQRERAATNVVAAGELAATVSVSAAPAVTAAAAVIDTADLGHDGFEFREPQVKTVIRVNDLLGDSDEKKEPSQKTRRGFRINSLPETFGRLREPRGEKEAAAAEREFARAYNDVHEPHDVHEPPVVHEEAPVTIDIKRLQGETMGWPARILLMMIALVALLALLIVTFPFDRYLPQVEAAVGRALRSPVKVGGMQVGLLPYPNLTLSHIEVGGPKPYLVVGHAHLVPDPLTLWAARPQIREVQIEDARLSVAGIDQAAAWFSDPAPDFVVGRAVLRNLALELTDARVEGLSGDMQFSPGGELARTIVSNAEGTLRVEAEPAGGLFRVTVAGNAWRMPFAPGALVAFIDGKGELTSRQLRLPKLEVRLFDGQAVGAGTLDWSDGYSLVGDMNLDHASLNKLMAAFEPGVAFDGEVDCKARFEARAKQFSRLRGELKVDGKFSAARAVLDRLDLVEAARSSGGTPVGSGNTRVDRLAGSLHCDGRGCAISGLTMKSGLMSAAGRIDIGQGEGKLDGLVEVAMQGSANVVRVPVAIGGSLAHPQLMRR